MGGENALPLKPCQKCNRKHWLFGHHAENGVLAELGSSVGVATCHGLDGPGLEFRQRQEFFSSSKPSSPALGPHPASYSMGAGVPGVKRAGREVNHQPPSVTYIKNRWSHSSAPHIPSWGGQR
jgi:hypothetical protein